MADFDVTTSSFTAGTLIQSSQVNTNFDDVSAVFNGDRDKYNPVPSLVPIGSIIAWHKTFGSADSGTTDATTANKLVQSGQNFLTTISVGMIVFNSTDSTYANVTAVDSNTTLSLSADIMATAEAYTIYKTPKLADGWVECSGQTVSDADSPYNGVAVPNLNGTTDATTYTLAGRGSSVTGTLGGAATYQWFDTSGNTYDSSGGTFADVQYATVAGSGTYFVLAPGQNAYAKGLPPHMRVIWIIRIK